MEGLFEKEGKYCEVRIYIMRQGRGGSPGNGTSRVDRRTGLVAAHRSFHEHHFSESKEGGVERREGCE